MIFPGAETNSTPERLEDASSRSVQNPYFGNKREMEISSSDISIVSASSFEELFEDDVTDVHVKVTGTNKSATVRVRRDNVLSSPVVADMDIRSFFGDVFRFQAENSTENRDFSMTVSSGKRIRVAVRTTLSGDSSEYFIRVLPSVVPPVFERISALVRELSLPYPGLVLVSGVTGSGKSTLLASIAQRHVDEGAHVVTVEDPVEYILRTGESGGYASQREIGKDVPDFASGVKMSLREDPDTILVGEVRDPETAMAALSAAETGHSVLATVHAGGCFGAVDRFLSLLGSGEYQAMRMAGAYLCGIHSTTGTIGGRTARSYEVFKSNDAARTHIRERATHRLAQARSGLVESEYKTTIVS